MRWRRGLCWVTKIESEQPVMAGCLNGYKAVETVAQARLANSHIRPKAKVSGSPGSCSLT